MNPEVEVVHLRRQVQLFKTLVTAQHRLMVQVRNECGHQMVDSLQRSITQHIKVQERALHHDLTDSAAALKPVGAAAAVPPSEATVKEASQKCARKLQGVTCSLLNLWYGDLFDSVAQAQHAAMSALVEFDSCPSEEALHGALKACKGLAETPLLDPSTNVSASKGPKGNPFEVDEELSRLYVDTVFDTISSVMGGGISAEGEALSGGNELPPRPTNIASTSFAETLAPPLKERQQSPSLSDANSTPVTSVRRDQQYVRSSSRGHRNNSSAMSQLLFGPQTSAESSGVQTPRSTSESERLHVLRGTLNRLEQQMGSYVYTRDNGSEAKHYALSKRIQKVKAELLKEEREVLEVSKAHSEVKELASQRKEWQRQKEVDMLSRQGREAQGRGMYF